MAQSVGDEYDDESGEQDPVQDAECDAYDGDVEGAIHPLPSGGLSQVDVKKAPRHEEVHPQRTLGSKQEGDLDARIDVTIHTKPTHEEKVRPPAAPVRSSSTGSSIGDLAAALARQRLVEYRRHHEEITERQKEDQAIEYQQRKQVRRMYTQFNQSIGVADVPSAVRYKEAVKAIKAEKNLKETEAKSEASNRWYRKIKRANRSACSSADYGEKVLAEIKRQRQQSSQQKAARRSATQTKLKELSAKAKLLVARTAGEYERGSFILKRGSG